MKRNEEIVSFIKENINNLSDREMAKKLSLCYVTIFNIRKKFSIERSIEFQKERRILSGKIGGSITAKYNHFGENNSNWKGGISKQSSRYAKIQAQKFPEKIKARRIAINARRSGKLTKQPCIKCGNTESFAHHEDYSKPLDVTWLCRKHHREIHENKN